MSKATAQPDYRDSLHRDVAETAQAVIAGTLGPIDAARRFVGLAAELNALDEEAFLFFLGLDSESDHFPLGAVREQWSESALEREDRERRDYEARVRDEAVKNCEGLLSKYSSSAAE